MSLRTTLTFDLDDNVMSLKDMVHVCLGLKKRDIVEVNILTWRESWSTYEIVVGKVLTEDKVMSEFAECFAIKNIYINGKYIGSNSDSETETETDPYSEICEIFPMIDTVPIPPPVDSICKILPLLSILLKEGRIMIGNTETGAVGQAVGFAPADDGESILLYADEGVITA